MTDVLHHYQPGDIEGLVELYNSCFEFAKRVGDLDWEYPFPPEQLSTYIENNELYGLRGEAGTILASVRLTGYPDRPNTILVGKLAVARDISGRGFTKETLLPAILQLARSGDFREIRLTCLAHNKRLISFYQGLGFITVDLRVGKADAGYPVNIMEMSLPL